MFNEPFASRIPGLFDGSKSGDQINLELTNRIDELLTSEILENIDTSEKFSYLTDAFEANSLLDWKPQVPIFMYHGDADVTVPFQNSVDSYEKLLSNGASTSIVTFTSLPGKTHSSGVIPYIELFLPKMLELR
ncbi:MAG: prolyl oligopeptidase family serine peptidase [Bacteroidota bacterium]